MNLDAAGWPQQFVENGLQCAGFSAKLTGEHTNDFALDEIGNRDLIHNQRLRQRERTTITVVDRLRPSPDE